MGGGPPYNVASLGFEWSWFVERQGGRRPLLVPGIERRASRFVVGESESPQVLMRHRRPASGPTADGGAHGPVQGSPPATSARIVRSDKIEPPTPDRRLRSSVPTVRRTRPRSNRGSAPISLLKTANPGGEQ